MFLDKDNYLPYKCAEKTVSFESFAFASDSVKSKPSSLCGVGKNCDIQKGVLGVGVGCSPIIMEGNTVGVVGNTTHTSGSAASQAQYHTIVSGDTLGALAIKYKTTVKKICQLNGITETTILKLGKKLRVK